MHLIDLLQNISYESFYGDLNSSIQGVTCDSRRARDGYIFVAISGQNRDGHTYIDNAINNGSQVIVGERFFNLPEDISYMRVNDSRKTLADLACELYGHPTRRLFIAGVTGTNGKSTVAHLAREVLGGAETALISTILNQLEEPDSSIVTTPTAPQIQRKALSALSKGKNNLILEVSSHGLEQERVRGVDFDLAVFTNLTQDHFDYHDNFANYFEAKRKLFTYLKSDDFAIINIDDPYGASLAKYTEAKTLTYGIESEGVDLKADQMTLEPDGSRFRVSYSDREFEIRTKFPGKFNIYNILAAVGIGIVKGTPSPEIKSRIEGIVNIEGRFEQFEARDGFTIVVDFAHTPDALKQVIETLKPFYERIITVFGCGGDSDKIKRPIMGWISGELSDYTIITSDNPKSENPIEIIDEIEKGLSKTSSEYKKIIDRGEAIKAGLSQALPGDVVLIAGKGHERRQEFKDKSLEFNDKEFLKRLDVLKENA